MVIVGHQIESDPVQSGPLRVAALEARVRELEADAAQIETYAADLQRTYAELRRHMQRLTVLHEVSTGILAALDLDEVMASMLDSLGQLASYETASIYLLDVLAVSVSAEGPGTVVPSDSLPRLRSRGGGKRSSARVGALEVDENTFAPDDGAVALAMRSQQTVVRPAGPGDGFEVVVPLRAGGRALGALQLCGTAEPSEEDVRILELLAAGGGVALQNAYLYQETQRLATTDSLTALFNRRHFDELLALEVDRARRMGYPLGFIMMDLDHFRLINDRYLHAGGDVVLMRVADVLRSRLRRTDIVGRVGGEEFAAILPGALLEEVAIVGEKVRHAVEELRPFSDEADVPTLPVTLSVGGVSFPGQSVRAEHLVNCADRALYEAKHRGRNQVRLWPDDVPGAGASGDEPGAGPSRPPEAGSSRPSA